MFPFLWFWWPNTNINWDTRNQWPWSGSARFGDWVLVAKTLFEAFAALREKDDTLKAAVPDHQMKATKEALMRLS